ncbi:M24 family metallopeptidase [Chloroflexota bacterium]
MAGRHGYRLGSGGAATDYTIGLADYDRLRKERLAKAQAYMKKHKMAAALLFKTYNIRYVTSTKFQMPLDFVERVNYCLAFAEHPPILFTHHGNPSGDCPWIKPEQRRVAFHWAQQAAGRDATDATTRKFAASIKEELKQKGLEGEKLGIDDIDEAGRQALVDAGLELENAMPVMLEARAVKTQDEINLVHMAAVNADAVHYAMYEFIKPGVRERDIKAVAYNYLYRAGSEPWGISIRSGGVVGGSLIDSDRIIQPGDVVTIDVTRCPYMGYYTCYYRNYLVGRKPTEKEKDMHKRCYEMVYRALDAIKPGVTTADTAKFWKTAKEAGHPSEEWVWDDDVAHGIGLTLYEYPISNRLWSFDYPQVYEKGMTIAVEAQVFDPMIGRLKLEEEVVVTDDGVEILTRMPVKDMMICAEINIAEC